MYEIIEQLPFICPRCAEDVDIGDDVLYCQHILFIWVYGDGEFWPYTTAGFAEAYLEAVQDAPEYMEFIDSHEFTENEEQEIAEQFIARDFEVMDSVSVPFVENVIMKVCPPGTKIFKDEGYYSGVLIGISSTLLT
ncbi:hypothetical protein ACFLR7_06825 [Acidobacteriota bacterium]